MATIIGKIPGGETLDANDGVTNSADVIIGNAGNDTIHGLGGNDIIKGGGGADTIYGDAGVDTATYDDSSVGVQVSPQLGKGIAGTAEGDTLISIENLYGSSHDDVLEGDAGANKLEGADGNDVLKGGGGADKLFGGAGNDILVANGLNDSFDGGDGIDTVDFSGSQLGYFVDLELGLLSQYYPHYEFSFTPDLVSIENVVGTQLNDFIKGDGNDNQLSGNGGDDSISSFAGNDKLDGGDGDDVLCGGAGADTLTGGPGADTFVFLSTNDSVVTNGAFQDVITDFTAGVDKIDLALLNLQFADLTIHDAVVGGVHTSYIGIDTNHNDEFGAGEFAIVVKMVGNNYLSSGDLIL